MYYFYHQFLQGVLAAEQWVTSQDLRRQPYSLLSVPSHKEATELFQRVKKTLGKEVGSHITIMKEATVQKPDAWPIRTQGSPNFPVDAESKHPKLMGYLLLVESGAFQLKDSSVLVQAWQDEVPIEVKTQEMEQEQSELEQFISSTDALEHGFPREGVSVEDLELLEETLREESKKSMEDLEDLDLFTADSLDTLQPILNFTKLHQNFNSKKQYTAVREDGKIILENSTLTFDGYQLAQDIDQAAQLLDKIFHHIEDISKHYGDALRNIEAQISDELHFIEFADADTTRCVKSYKRLQELRVKRRCVKDSMLMANLLVRTMGKELPKKLCNVSEKINHLDQRTYEVRVPEEFQH